MVQEGALGAYMGMSSVKEIVKGYARTLKGARDGKPALGPVASQILMPLAFGAASCAAGWSVPRVSDAVAGISIVASLLCSVAALLFQVRIDLRMRLEEDERSENQQHFLVSDDLELLDEMFSQVMWVILEGFVLVLIMVLSEWLGLLGTKPLSAQAATCITFIIVCGVANFVVVIGAVLKRLNRVYQLIAMNKRN